MKSKNFLAITLAAIFVIGLAGCSDKVQTTTQTTTQTTNKNAAFTSTEKKLMDSLAPLPKASKAYKIAAVEITLANPFWVSMKQGYADAAKEYGVTCDVFAASKEDDVNGQLDLLKTAIGKDYDAVSISSITPYNLIPGVAEATKKKMPVIAVGTSVDAAKAKEANAKVNAFITSSFEDQGKIGAEFIIGKIKSGKVAIITGLSGAAQSEARKTGAQKAFEANKDIKLVSVQAGDWDRKKAYDLATNLIQANPDLKGIFCANDDMALGVVDALKAANKKSQVTVTGIDSIDEAKKSIANNELDATVAMSPYLFGKGGLILALKVLEGQEVKSDIYWTPLGLVTKENVATYDGWK